MNILESLASAEPPIIEGLRLALEAAGRPIFDREAGPEPAEVEA